MGNENAGDIYSDVVGWSPERKEKLQQKSKTCWNYCSKRWIKGNYWESQRKNKWDENGRSCCWNSEIIVGVWESRNEAVNYFKWPK